MKQSLDAQTVCLEFERLCFEKKETLSNQMSLTILGSIPPNEELFLSCTRTLKENELRTLGILSWFIGDPGWLLRNQLERKIPRLSTEGQISLKLILSSRYLAVEYILDNFSPRDFFGNLLKSARRLLGSMRIQLLRPRRAKRKIRRRGYRDHGTARLSDRWLPSSDSDLTELQNELEYQREVSEDTFQFLRGLLGEI